MFNPRKALYDYIDDPEVRRVAMEDEVGLENLQFNYACNLLEKVQPMVDAGDYGYLVSFLRKEADCTAALGKYDESDVCRSLLTALQHYLNHN